jgi:hypothetical protein
MFQGKGERKGFLAAIFTYDLFGTYKIEEVLFRDFSSSVLLHLTEAKV